MAKTNNIIELNGKRYDARTGEFLGVATSQDKTPLPVVDKPETVRRGVVMDGIIRPTAHHTKPSLPLAPAPPKGVYHATPKTKRVVAPVAHHKPQHSKTLMRHVVKAPIATPKHTVKVQAPAALTHTKPAALLAKPKLSSEQIDMQRAERAIEIPRSKMVVRFQPRTRGPARLATKTLHPAAALPDVSTARPYVTRPAKPNTPSQTMFEKAIAAANSHEQLPPQISKSRTARRHAKKYSAIWGTTAAIFAVLLLAGFIGYQNRTNIQLQLASSRAGFRANMPSSTPAGFSIKGLSYSPGTVTIGLHNNNQSVNITQKASNWDSQTLLDNFVATSGYTYDTVQANGRIVYIYDNGDATWVNSGIWYQVSGDARLSRDQMINLAASM